MTHYESIRRILARVRRRWRTLRALEASVRVALAASAILSVALVAARWTDGAPLILVFLGVATLLLVAGAAVWAFLPLRDAPDDARVARFIEEQNPALDDRLVSAVDAARSAGRASPVLVEPMLADAARTAGAVDIDTVVSRRSLRRAAVQASAAAALLAALFLLARGPGRQALDSASMVLFPSSVTLEVTPGHARVKAGEPLAIQARLIGNRAPVAASVEVAAADGWRATGMSADAGAFRLSLPPVDASFKYRVVAGWLTSPEYEVSVVRAPRVTRIDLEYAYPASLGLKPRSEEDGGDIYAPAGTEVRIRVHVDRPIATARMTMADGDGLALAAESPTILSASMRIAADNSYRVALDDGDGFVNPGDTEYFIRMLEDRPPEVRIVSPAADKSVTPLEEVEIAASADDDYGISRLELVYAVRGRAEQVVPLGPATPAPTVTGRHTIYVEDLRVAPGDFIAYYVRARDVARGRQSSDAKSDMYFLEVAPFDQQFRLAESDAQQGGGGESVAELIRAQKEIIAATWKLERRAQTASGARSAEDIRAVSRAEEELRTRVERTASAFRETTMRDPRRRPAARGEQPAPGGAARVEENAMTAASLAMGRAIASLDALKTGEAMQPEMEALNHLLRAQTEITEREVSRQQASSGSAGNNRNLDMSTLFDRELKDRQQTNYETTASSQQPPDRPESMLDKIKDLARRQDELLKREQELARQRQEMAEAELKRELERLTRDQSQLRERAEELSRQMGAQAASDAGQPPRAEATAAGEQPGSAQSRQMREVSEAMRGAASELRREDPGKASASGSEALETLRQLQQQLEQSGPNEPLRALREAQLEARQLADAQRQIASEVRRSQQGEAGKDMARRLAGEQERLAERARRLQEDLSRQASSQQEGRRGDSGAQADRNATSAAGSAARTLEAQQLARRMRESAGELREAAGATSTKDPRAEASRQEEIARSLDRLAEGLTAGGARDGDEQRLSAQLARAQELRERMEGLSNDLARQGDTPGTAGADSELARLQEEYQRQLAETRDLLGEMKQQQDASLGAGITPEGQGSVTSAPGTEAFKQDFAGWDALRRQATVALERAQAALDEAEAALLKKLQSTQAKDRLAAGVDDKPPAAYEKQVDSYFKALAEKQKP